MKRINFGCIFTISLMIICAFVTRPTYANGGYEGGSEGTAGNKSNCLTATNTVTYCGAYGVSWRWYSLGSNVNSKAETDCNAIGTDGYYVLAYEKIQKGSSAGSWSYVGAQTFDKGVQVFQVMNPPNTYSDGSYNYKYANIAGAEAWDKVKKDHDDAEKYNLIGPDEPEWSKTTWFCWDRNGLVRKGNGIITANSGVSVDGVDGSKVGADVGPNETAIVSKKGFGKNNVITVTVKTSNSSVSGNMWHNQYYENEDANWDETKKRWSDRSFRLDLEYDIADGDVDACEGKGNCDKKWKIEPWKKTKEHTNVGNNRYTLNLDSVGSTATKCQTMTVEPLKFAFTSANDGEITKETGRAHTSVCVTAKRVAKPEEPTDEFKANSSVEVPNASSQLGGYDPGKQTSDWDKAVGLKVSTDSDSLQFTLSHNMSFSVEDSNRNIWRYWDPCAYTVGSGENITCVGDWVYVGSSTSLSYELTGDTGKVAENSKSENGTYKAGIDKNTQNQNELVASNTYTISGMEPGKTYRVCHKIKYTPKSYTTPITEKLIWTGPWSIGPQWIYGTPQANGDSEDSEACIEITRPENPPEGGPDPYGPKNNGSSNADVMFAGEQTNIGWKVEAKSVPTRRVTDYSAVGFVVRDDVASAAAMNSGMAHQPSDPCVYFGSKAALIGFGGTTCAEFSGDGLSVAENTDGLSGIKVEKIPSSSGAFTKQINIAVPDNVGAKYCNSYGYKWGYWWGVVKGETAENLTDDAATWTHVNGKDYWTNYSPACRTIAKKPNFAIWNGSIFSGGGIVSSTAPRHNDANSGQPTKLNDDGNKTTYGSWAENLAVAGSNISRFASSGAYGAGLPGLVSGNNWNMAWLTISNDGLKSSGSVLGNSGINYNSSYDTRLSAYLKGSATNDVPNQSATTYSGASGVAGTQILYFNPGGTNGTLTINGNVTLDSAKKENIYELPQVVIYVDGNIAIDPSVTRLDAWLIATGDIDTCRGWQDNTTETRSLNRNANATCDNQLQINGPVIANSVKLHRTFGADNLVSYTGSHGDRSNKNVSSEVFNLSALTYLWSFAQAGRYQSSYTDAYARELAPRY